jgi:nucleoside-diphosphate-sugar epimerase
MEIGVALESSGNIALVTGATGFIGGRLAARLVDEGRSVRLLVRAPEKLAPALRGKVDVVAGDLADENALGRAVQGVSVIFHCAANVSSWDAWDAYYSANVEGVKNLLNAITQHNPGLSRLVHVSTVDVYGFPQAPCDEECKPAKSGFGYCDSKLVGESLVRAQCERAGIPCTIIRPGNVIGPGSQFITRIGDELKSGLMLTVDGGRTNAGLVYVDNLVDYILWAAESEKAIGQCYNVRDSYDVTWSEFIGKFRRGIEGRGIVLNLPFWAADAAARVFEWAWRIFMPAREPLLHRLLVRIFGRTCGHSAEKIRRDSALESRIGFDEAMETSIRWFLEK